jgi:predicted kinase
LAAEKREREAVKKAAKKERQRFRGLLCAAGFETMATILTERLQTDELKAVSDAADAAPDEALKRQIFENLVARVRCEIEAERLKASGRPVEVDARTEGGGAFLRSA